MDKLRRSPSASELWDSFIEADASRSSLVLADIWHFSDNQEEANYCLKLVLQGTKRATTYSLWEVEHENEAFAAVGELNIVTDWSGNAACIIETTKITRLRFDEITQRQASIEGEGDKSLAY